MEPINLDYTWCDGIVNLTINLKVNTRREIIFIQVTQILSVENSFIISSISVPDNLDDGVLYTFQVSSISTYNYEAGSDIYEIVTPQYRIVQAITIATVGLLVLLALAAILFYMKRHLFSTYRSDDKVLD